jgi:hypothetical protein
VIEDEKCLHCRVDELETWLAGLSAAVGWLLIAAAAYVLYKSGIVNLEVFHG